MIVFRRGRERERERESHKHPIELKVTFRKDLPIAFTATSPRRTVGEGALIFSALSLFYCLFVKIKSKISNLMHKL
jgi:hypothetical protein